MYNQLTFGIKKYRSSLQKCQQQKRKWAINNMDKQKEKKRIRKNAYAHSPRYFIKTLHIFCIKNGIN